MAIAEQLGHLPEAGVQLSSGSCAVAAAATACGCEAGLGGGLDQAEEAQLGITDEELERAAGTRPAPKPSPRR